MIINNDVFKELPKVKSKSQDIIFSDVPYQLGSTYYINKNTGKVEYKKSQDFMNKWSGLNEKQLEIMFEEFYRVLKNGGYTLLYGQDRQIFPFMYYAVKAGLEVCQFLYTYQISNFPKNFDVSKGLDRHFGKEREIIGIDKNKLNKMAGHCFGEESYQNNGFNKNSMTPEKACKVTAPATDLAKKYFGTKYGIAPLKQTTEIIMVFRRPLKNKGIIQDIIDYEEGNITIHPNIINVDKGKVPYESQDDIIPQLRQNKLEVNGGQMYRGNSVQESKTKAIIEGSTDGRYPAQLFLTSIDYSKDQIKKLINTEKGNIIFSHPFIGIDISVFDYMNIEKAIEYVMNHLDKLDSSKLFDKQSGELKSGDNCTRTKIGTGYHGQIGKAGDEQITYGDSGGSSRVLHNCKYDLEEFYYQHIFYQKPSKRERNLGCEDLEKKDLCSSRINKGNIKDSKWNIDSRSPNGGYKSAVREPSFNNHPTLKSLKLNYKILELFSGIDIHKQKILIPFSGVNSEYISAMKMGYKEENIIAIEISKEFVNIGDNRVSFWKDVDFEEFMKTKKIIKNGIDQKKENSYTDKRNFAGKLFGE